MPYNLAPTRGWPPKVKKIRKNTLFLQGRNARMGPGGGDTPLLHLEPTKSKAGHAESTHRRHKKQMLHYRAHVKPRTRANEEATRKKEGAEKAAEETHRLRVQLQLARDNSTNAEVSDVERGGPGRQLAVFSSRPMGRRLSRTPTANNNPRFLMLACQSGREQQGACKEFGWSQIMSGFLWPVVFLYKNNPYQPSNLPKSFFYSLTREHSG